jgi:Mor family transcriptional regulator
MFKKIATNHPEKIMYPFDAIMETQGFDAVYALIEQFNGQTIYVPSARKVFSECIEEAVRKEFRGGNIEKLSKKYGFTARHVRRVLARS